MLFCPSSFILLLMLTCWRRGPALRQTVSRTEERYFLARSSLQVLFGTRELHPSSVQEVAQHGAVLVGLVSMREPNTQREQRPRRDAEHQACQWLREPRLRTSLHDDLRSDRFAETSTNFPALSTGRHVPCRTNPATNLDPHGKVLSSNVPHPCIVQSFTELIARDDDERLPISRLRHVTRERCAPHGPQLVPATVVVSRCGQTLILLQRVATVLDEDDTKHFAAFSVRDTIVPNSVDRLVHDTTSSHVDVSL